MLDCSSQIIVADDDSDDQFLIREALEEIGFPGTTRFVENGQALMDCLDAGIPRNGIILLDLNMPIKDGREVLREMKRNPKLRQIPVAVLTTSSREDDVHLVYNLQASSYIVKPTSYEELKEILRVTIEYWFGIVRVPAPC